MAEIFETTIRDLGSEGHGIGSLPNGVTVFILGCWPGELVRAKITRWQKRIAFADLIEIITPSPHRITPPCPHHGTSVGNCGACPWQFVHYEAQVAAKQRRIEQQLDSLTKNIHPIIPAPSHYAYRNRVQFKSDGSVLAYMSHSSNQLAAIDSCLILTEHNQTTLAGLVKKLPNPQWRAKKNQPWTTVNIDESIITPTINQRLPFQQANSAQNRRMRQWLNDELVKIKPNSFILELFCGSGNFTEIIAHYSKQIIAIDSDPFATEALKNKNLAGVTVYEKNLFLPTVFEIPTPQKGIDLLVLDPPRDGLKQKTGLLEYCGRSLRTILYISCDLATFKRDAEYFIEQGFNLESVQPIDMAPQTPHLELLTVFSK